MPYVADSHPIDKHITAVIEQCICYISMKCDFEYIKRYPLIRKNLLDCAVSNLQLRNIIENLIDEYVSTNYYLDCRPDNVDLFVNELNVLSQLMMDGYFTYLYMSQVDIDFKYTISRAIVYEACKYMGCASQLPIELQSQLPIELQSQVSDELQSYRDEPYLCQFQQEDQNLENQHAEYTLSDIYRCTPFNTESVNNTVFITETSHQPDNLTYLMALYENVNGDRVIINSTVMVMSYDTPDILSEMRNLFICPILDFAKNILLSKVRFCVSTSDQSSVFNFIIRAELPNVIIDNRCELRNEISTHDFFTKLVSTGKLRIYNPFIQPDQILLPEFRKLYVDLQSIAIIINPETQYIDTHIEIVDGKVTSNKTTTHTNPSSVSCLFPGASLSLLLALQMTQEL